MLLVLVTDVLPPATYVRPLLGTGFCGALTTFSSVTVTSDQLVVGGNTATGVLYLAASMTSGLVCAAFGLVLGRSIEPTVAMPGPLPARSDPNAPRPNARA